MASHVSTPIKVVIVGAGGHGLVVLDILNASHAVGGRFKAVGFIDADPAIVRATVGGLPVFGHLNILPKLKLQQKITHAIVAIGDNRVRRSYAEKLLASGIELINAIHPSAVVSPTVQLGCNIVIAAGGLICTGVVIGDSALINTGAIIDHECQIGQGAHICPGAKLAGRVTIGNGAFVGLGANVIQCVRVGNDATIGAGAVVLQDVESATTVVGVPAKAVRR